jgi:hypothetical protein
MTLGNMRANGVRSLDVSCWLCHHRAIFNVEGLARPCTGADVRAAQGVHEGRDHPRRCAAELAGAVVSQFEF